MNRRVNNNTRPFSGLKLIALLGMLDCIDVAPFPPSRCYSEARRGRGGILFGAVYRGLPGLSYCGLSALGGGVLIDVSLDDKKWYFFIDKGLVRDEVEGGWLRVE